jgi:hypothetical protein
MEVYRCDYPGCGDILHSKMATERHTIIMDREDKTIHDKFSRGPAGLEA